MTGENCIFHSGSESDSLPNRELPNRESIKLIAIGSPEGVNEIIHQLHVLNARDATTWSRFLPTPKSPSLRRGRQITLLIYFQ
jgi:hypothetical protein